MTDLEITRLCAEAMEFTKGIGRIGLRQGRVYVEGGGEIRIPCGGYDHGGTDWIPYDPLHDDTQAMALVRKFDLSVWGKNHTPGEWKYHAEYGDAPTVLGHGDTHNRAICECVAAMQAAE